MELAQMQIMAKSIAASKMFGVDNEDQALALMLLCQAEGLHPVMALRRYHIIDGKPAMRADALQGEFEKTGLILWHFRTDQICAASFYRDKSKVDDAALARGKAQCQLLIKASRGETVNVQEMIDTGRPGEVTVLRAFDDAVKKGLAVAWKDGKEVIKKNWRQSPRQMLHARTLTEGVRAVNPGLIAGVYTEEEIIDIEPETYDQRPPREVIERNVREATANAVAAGDEVTQVQERDGVTTTKVVNTAAVTADNYKDVLCHIGKDNGIKWKKVGELHKDVVTWLRENWVPKLSPSATDDDMRLKKALEFAVADVGTVDEAPPCSESATIPGDGLFCAAPSSQKDSMVKDLLSRIEDLVITEDQAMEYLRKQGVSNQTWKKLADMPDGMVAYLHGKKGWDLFGEVVKADTKPKVSATIPKPRKTTRGK